MRHNALNDFADIYVGDVLLKVSGTTTVSMPPLSMLKTFITENGRYHVPQTVDVKGEVG